jgi:fatty acid-binding protein DegV
MHIDALPEAQAICAEFKTRLGLVDIPITLLPPAIVVHAGPKALAVGFFTH